MKFKYLKPPARDLSKGLLSINDRIEFLRCVLGYDIQQFGRKIGGSHSAMVNVLSKEQNSDPSMKMVNSILILFPVNKEWIFLGTGEPFAIKDVSSFIFERSGGADLDSEIINRIKTIRQEKGMSQAIFSSKLNMSRDAYAFMETNRSTLQLYALKRLITEVGLNPMWILFGSGEKYLKKL